jgi:hypothetical protein
MAPRRKHGADEQAGALNQITSSRIHPPARGWNGEVSLDQADAQNWWIVRHEVARGE